MNSGHFLTRPQRAPGDAYPQFHAETYPPGTAPAEHSFEPNPDLEDQPGAHAAASDTLVGSTSADVDRGMGHPVSGMTSAEMHGRGKKERSGLAGVGADPRDPIRERRLDEDDQVRERNAIAAEDRWPVPAEEVGAERTHDRRHERRHVREHGSHQGHHEGHHHGHQGHGEGHHEGHHGKRE